MKTLKHILFIVGLLLYAYGSSAQTFTLSGKVSDDDGNAIELATVSCLEQGAVTMANLKGEYSLKLHSADSVVVKFSMVGYQTRTRVLRRPKGNQRLLVALQKQVNETGNKLTVKNPGKVVREVFAISGFNKRLNIV